jgi:hypothetical protein
MWRVSKLSDARVFVLLMVASTIKRRITEPASNDDSSRSARNRTISVAYECRISVPIHTVTDCKHLAAASTTLSNAMSRFRDISTL